MATKGCGKQIDGIFCMTGWLCPECQEGFVSVPIKSHQNPSESRVWKTGFNLSEKIVRTVDVKGYPPSTIRTRDVREFIKRLKERLKGNPFHALALETIDKLAGKELI